MNALVIFSQAFSLFRASFSSLSPFILLTAICSFGMGCQLKSIAQFSVMGWCFFLIGCLLSFTIHLCLVLGAYCHYHQLPFQYLKISQRALSKLFSVILLMALLLLPVLIALFVMLVPEFIFGLSTEEMLSKNSGGWLQGLMFLISVFMIVAGALCVYSVILYGYMAEMEIIIKDLTPKESIKKSKALVQNHKWYVATIFFMAYVLCMAIRLIGESLMNELTAAVLGAVIIAPFVASLIVVLYDTLEKKSNLR